jgi:hypothetical protein
MNFQTLASRRPVGRSGSNDSLNAMIRRPSLDIIKSGSNESLDTMKRRPSLDIDIQAKKKPLMINVAINNTVASLSESIFPDIYENLVTMILMYVIQNYKIVKRKPRLLLHPKKILNAMPLSVSGFLLDTCIANKVDGIDNDTMHLAAQVVLKTLQISMTFL